MVANQPLVPLEMSIQLPQVPINRDVENIPGFILHGLGIKSTGQHAFDSKCVGGMCDKQDIYKNGRTSEKCACVQMNQRNQRPGIALNLTIQERTGNTFETFELSSQHFIKTFIFTGPMPPGT